ncbi:MAG TPA: GNAT family N-acetyltransferase [bacterium]|nr:GNAT family N-acetyltransferase [bacterium]
MKNTSFRLRKAVRRDSAALLQLIRGIAEYEKMSDQVQNTRAAIVKNGFGRRPYFEALLGEIKKNGRWQAVSFALYFYTYSTFTGKPSLYLEDLFVEPAFRGSGIGKALFLRLAHIARQRGCGRMEWSVLNWNKPAIQFYVAHGATAMKGWTVYRLDEQALARLDAPA